jgi:hypothetical protein
MAKTRRVRFSKKRKTRRAGGYFDAYMPSSKKTPPAPATAEPAAEPAAEPETKPKGFSKSSDYSAYAQNTLKANRSAMNMPVTLAAINTKLNALLIHNKVNYKFSNGYTARDYNIENVVAESSNEGRGELIPNSARGQITGAQSGIYNKVK